MTCVTSLEIYLLAIRRTKRGKATNDGSQSSLGQKTESSIRRSTTVQSSAADACYGSQSMLDVPMSLPNVLRQPSANSPGQLSREATTDAPAAADKC